jgi:hypothetical protein
MNHRAAIEDAEARGDMFTIMDAKLAEKNDQIAELKAMLRIFAFGPVYGLEEIERARVLCAPTIVEQRQAWRDSLEVSK